MKTGGDKNSTSRDRDRDREEDADKYKQGLCRLGLELFSNGPENIYLHQTR